MTSHRCIAIGLACLLGLAMAGYVALTAGPATVAGPRVVEVPAAMQSFRPAGQYLVGNRVVDPVLETVRHVRPLVIMTFQVTQAEYAACVAAGSCPVATGKADATRPQTDVSYTDAVAYAEWLSAATGQRWRLPTDAEWARAAGSRFYDDALGIGAETGNPAARWLARYGAELAQRAPVDPQVRPQGAFGMNEFGLADVAGNVWEWTETCYDTVTLAEDGRTVTQTSPNCGIRVAEGQHRAYISDFVRDARGGGCGGGVPPDYLGFRLVRDDADS